MTGRYQDALLAGAEEILLLVDPASLVSLVGQPVTEIECALADVFFWEEVRGGGSTDEQTMESLYRRADGSLLAARKTVRRLA